MKLVVRSDGSATGTSIVAEDGMRKIMIPATRLLFAVSANEVATLSIDVPLACLELDLDVTEGEAVTLNGVRSLSFVRELPRAAEA